MPNMIDKMIDSNKDKFQGVYFNPETRYLVYQALDNSIKNIK